MKKTIIKCGKLFDGIKDELQENMEILVNDKKIEMVEEICLAMKIRK